MSSPQTKQVDDGGPAFPIPPVLHPEGGPDSYWSQHPASGMSLRDYFAAKAMQGILADPSTNEADGKHPRENNYANRIGSAAYTFADAMLAARKSVSP